MFRLIATAAAFGLGAAPALAQSGDPEAGARVFNQCQTCHVVRNEAGETLAGRNARTGPNLYGIVGAPAASQDFDYGDDLIAARERGLVWDEAALNSYLENPGEFLQTFLEDNGARSRMQFQLRREEDRLDVIAFLATFGPAPADAPAAAPATE